MSPRLLLSSLISGGNVYNSDKSLKEYRNNEGRNRPRRQYILWPQSKTGHVYLKFGVKLWRPSVLHYLYAHAQLNLKLQSEIPTIKLLWVTCIVLCPVLGITNIVEIPACAVQCLESLLCYHGNFFISAFPHMGHCVGFDLVIEYKYVMGYLCLYPEVDKRRVSSRVLECHGTNPSALHVINVARKHHIYISVFRNSHTFGNSRKLDCSKIC